MRRWTFHPSLNIDAEPDLQMWGVVRYNCGPSCPFTPLLLTLCHLAMPSIGVPSKCHAMWLTVGSKQLLFRMWRSELWASSAEQSEHSWIQPRWDLKLHGRRGRELVTETPPPHYAPRRVQGGIYRGPVLVTQFQGMALSKLCNRIWRQTFMRLDFCRWCSANWERI